MSATTYIVDFDSKTTGFAAKKLVKAEPMVAF